MAIAVASILIAVLLLAGLILVVWRRGKRPGETDYRAFFTMGIGFLAVGSIFLLACLQSDAPIVLAIPQLAMGLVYLAIGLANRDKWRP